MVIISEVSLVNGESLNSAFSDISLSGTAADRFFNMMKIKIESSFRNVISE